MISGHGGAQGPCPGLRQEDCLKCEASQHYIVRTCLQNKTLWPTFKLSSFSYSYHCTSKKTYEVMLHVNWEKILLWSPSNIKENTVLSWPVVNGSYLGGNVNVAIISKIDTELNDHLHIISLSGQLKQIGVIKLRVSVYPARS